MTEVRRLRFRGFKKMIDLNSVLIFKDCELCDNVIWVPEGEYRQLCPEGMKNASGHK